MLFKIFPLAFQWILLVGYILFSALFLTNAMTEGLPDQICQDGASETCLVNNNIDKEFSFEEEYEADGDEEEDDEEEGKLFFKCRGCLP